MPTPNCLEHPSRTDVGVSGGISVMTGAWWWDLLVGIAGAVIVCWVVLRSGSSTSPRVSS